jgi:hypothetical protein
MAGSQCRLAAKMMISRIASHRVVGHGIAPGGRKDACRQRDDDGDREGEERERQGARDRLEDDLRHRDPAAVDRGAKVALQRVGEPDHVLHEERAVEPELVLHRRDLVGAAGIGQHRRDRVAGHEAQHEEDQRGHRPHHDDRPDQSAQYIRAQYSLLGRGPGRACDPAGIGFSDHADQFSVIRSRSARPGIRLSAGTFTLVE